MARPLRIEYPGAYYHVMNRGLAYSDIFLDDNDRQRFLLLIGETCKFRPPDMVCETQRKSSIFRT